MDDVDAAEALQAKNMLLSGNWISQHLNGTLYLDKAPLKYWITAALYSVFGIHDLVARIPTVLAVMALCWLVVSMGQWADSSQAGFYSGLVLSTSIGLFLFTRTIIPDVLLTLFIALSLWCLLRALESQKPSYRWALGFYAATACAVLTKGLIGLVFPVAIGSVYLMVTRQLPRWRRLYPLPGLVLFLAVVLPWHVAAMLQNPPLFDFTLNPGSHFGGKFRGFFWFYFVNEQALRFLNQRWPRDYNTVPLPWFWLYHLLWFFPWSFLLPALARLQFKPVDKVTRLRVLALCWIAVVLLFFTFSTTQEYYSMPIYPAVALLVGSAMATDSKWLHTGMRATGAVWIVGAAIILFILIRVWTLPSPGDIYVALAPHPSLYTLSLGHMADLTLPAFAYLRLPLTVAGIALGVGGMAVLRSTRERGYLAIALMLVVFFQAARLALVVFDPYLSSHTIARRMSLLPRGLLIVAGKYNPLSSLFFYSTDRVLQNDDDLDILEYGSLAPGAPKISVSDEEMKQLWRSPQRVYIVAKAPKLRHLTEVLGDQHKHLIVISGDKYLFGNQW